MGGGFPHTDDTNATSAQPKTGLVKTSIPARYQNQLEGFKPLSEYGLKNNKVPFPSPPSSVRRKVFPPHPATQNRQVSSPFQTNAFNRSRMAQSQSNASPSRIPVLASPSNSRRPAASTSLKIIDYSEEEQEAILRARGTSFAVKDSSARDAWTDEWAARSAVVPSHNGDYRDSPSSYKRKIPMGSKRVCTHFVILGAARIYAYFFLLFRRQGRMQLASTSNWLTIKLC